MKKTLFVCGVLGMALAMTGCRTSSESAYKKAYEKAKAQEMSAPVVETPVVETPVVTPVVTPVTAEQAEAPKAEEKVNVRTENLSVIDGKALLNYSVVVGSFGLRANATNLAETLRNAGYDARVAFNSEVNKYRVVASSFNTREEAVSSRDQLRSKYADAWLLYQK